MEIERDRERDSGERGGAMEIERERERVIQGKEGERWR